MKKTVSAILATAFLMTGAGAPAPAQQSTEADEAIKFRKLVIGTMGRSAISLLAMAQGKLDQEEHFTMLANQMAANAALIPDAFRMNTTDMEYRERTSMREDGTLWNNWEDFISRAEALREDVNAVADAANAGDMAAAQAGLQAVFENCKGCHDRYRK